MALSTRRIEAQIESEMRGLAREWGYTPAQVDRLFLEINLAGREIDALRREAAAELKRIQAQDRAESRVSRGLLVSVERRGGICPTCFMEMPLSGVCSDCE